MKTALVIVFLSIVCSIVFHEVNKEPEITISPTIEWGNGRFSQLWTYRMIDRNGVTVDSARVWVMRQRIGFTTSHWQDSSYLR